MLFSGYGANYLTFAGTVQEDLTKKPAVWRAGDQTSTFWLNIELSTSRPSAWAMLWISTWAP